MANIYQLEKSTLYMCNECLDSHGPVPGAWHEKPLEECSICGEVDLLAREELDRWHYEQDQRMWEDHIAPDIYNPQELK